MGKYDEYSLTDMLKVGVFSYAYTCCGMLFFRSVSHFSVLKTILSGFIYHTLLVFSLIVLLSLIFNKD